MKEYYAISSLKGFYLCDGETKETCNLVEG